MRRSVLVGLAVVLLALGAGLAMWQVASNPTTLRLAVGPAGSEDARLIAAAAQYLAREHEGTRLKVLATEGEIESARALDSGEADLAVVRNDIAMPAKAQSVVVMHRDVAVLVTPAGRGITTVSGLRGKIVGIVRPLAANVRILEVLSSHYDLSQTGIANVMLEGPGEVEAAFRDGRIDAVLAVGTLSGRTVGETVTAATAAGGGAAPVFLPVSEADAIAQRSPLYESFDIVRGAFGGSSPRPAETTKTLAVNHRLVASTALDANIVAEVTRLIFTMRPSLALDVPLANRIEAPDTSKSSSFPVHPGASAYYEGEVQTFIERNENLIYLGAMGLSVVGSAFAGLASSANARRRARTLGLLDRLLGIVRLARAAASGAELDALEQETDEILAVALGKAGSGSLDETGVSAFTLGLDQARQAIVARRTALSRPDAPVAQAAE